MTTTCPESELIPLLLRGELEGSERERLERHLDACDVCAERLERLSALDDALSRVAGAPSRGACRGSDAVLAFADGTLSGPESAAVEEHIARCDSCRALLADLWALDGPARYDVRERVVEAALRRLERESTAAVLRISRSGIELVRRFAGQAEAPLPALAGARDPGGVGLAWSGPDGLTVGLVVARRAGRAAVIGRALVDDGPEAGLTVEMRGGAVRRGPETADPAGRFGPWPMEEGENVLRFRRPGRDEPSVVTLLLEDETAD